MSEENATMEPGKSPEIAKAKAPARNRKPAPRQSASRKPAAAAPVQAQRPDRSVSPHKKRVPLGVRNRLTFGNLDPNYYYRVINDKDDRIERALEAGYEFVESNQRLGDIQAGDASPVGAHVSKPVGGGTVGYLMRQPMEYHEEDQKTKMAHIDELENATKPKKEQGQYGAGLTRG